MGVTYGRTRRMKRATTLVPFACCLVLLLACSVSATPDRQRAGAHPVTRCMIHHAYHETSIYDRRDGYATYSAESTVHFTPPPLNVITGVRVNATVVTTSPLSGATILLNDYVLKRGDEGHGGHRVSPQQAEHHYNMSWTLGGGEHEHTAVPFPVAWERAIAKRPGEGEDELTRAMAMPLHNILPDSQKSMKWAMLHNNTLSHSFALSVLAVAPVDIGDWSITVCYEGNLTMLHSHNGTEMKVTAMSGRSGRRTNIFAQQEASALAQSTQNRFMLPGSGLLQSTRNLFVKRMEDDQKCVRARYSFNIFEQMNRRYCCSKSRIFFLRHWRRKNFTLRCRRFFS